MLGSVTRSRTARLLLAGGLAAAGFTFVGGSASPAGAVSVTPKCDAFLYNPDGTLPPTPAFTGVDLPALEVPSLGGGTVETGVAFEITSSGNPVGLPGSITEPVPANIVEVKNITLKFQINGAASVGSPRLTGNTVNALASTAGNTVTLTMRGSNSPSWHTASGPFYFPGGSTFTPPTVKLPVVAPAAPGSITGRLTQLGLDVVVALAPGANTAVHVECGLDVAVGTTTVVAPPPPPPGAPDAINDTLSTKKGEAVTIDVLANDVADAQRPIDLTTLDIVEVPTKGWAEVTDDAKILYRPDADALGVDSFRYVICSVLTEDELADLAEAIEELISSGEEIDDPVELIDELELPCDVATVSVTIEDPTAPAPVGTPGPGPAAPATPGSSATAGGAGSAQLPRTGGPSTVLASAGTALLALGALATHWSRRRSATAR